MHLQKLVRFALIPILSIVACGRIISHVLANFGVFPSILGRDIVNPGSLAYKYAILVPNYFEHGFVRRGLGGTVMALISGGRSLEPVVSLAAFHLLSAIWLAIPLVLLLHKLAARTGREWIWLGLVLIVSPHLFLGWSQDVGRADMLAIGFIAWSVLILVQGRYYLAMAPLLIGFLVHEIALIYGVFPLIVMWFLDYRKGETTLRQGFAIFSVLVSVLLVIVVAQATLSLGSRDVASAMLASEPPSFNRDKATYLTTTGLRSIISSSCMSFGRSATPLFIAANFIILAIYAAILLVRSRRTALLVAFAAALPMALITVVAIDYGRWLMLAAMNAWLIVVALRLKEGRPPAPSSRDYAVSAVLLVALLAMGLPTTHSADPGVEKAAGAILGKPALERKTLVACDPDWRKAI